MVSFENFVKSMPPILLELKVIPSFCFAFKSPDDVTATNYIRTTVSYGCRASVSGISIRNKNSIVLLRSPCFSLIQKKYKAVELGMGSHMFLIGPSYLPYLAICRQHLLLANNRANFFLKSHLILMPHDSTRYFSTFNL